MKVLDVLLIAAGGSSWMAKTDPLFALRVDRFATSDNRAAFNASCRFPQRFNISRILVSLSLIPLTK